MKKTISLIFLFLSTFFFISCGKLDINKLAIVTAIGIDEAEDGINVSIQIINPNAFGPHAKDVSSVILYTTKGRTLQEAFRGFSQYLNNRPYYSHFQILVFGEKLARKGITPYINFFLINQQTMHSFNVFVVQGDTAENLLKINSIILIPSIAIEGKVESSLKLYGVGSETRIEEIAYSFHRSGFEVALASLIIIGDVTKPNDFKEIPVKLTSKASGVACFKDQRLQGFLDTEETIGFNLMKGNVENVPIVVTKKDGILASAEVGDLSANIKVEMVNNKPKYTIKIKGKAQVTEDASGETMDNTEYAKDIENRVSYEVKTMVEKCIKKIKELKTDIVGFGDLIHKYHPKAWEEIIKDYDNIFPNLEIEVVIDIKVTRILP